MDDDLDLIIGYLNSKSARAADQSLKEHTKPDKETATTTPFAESGGDVMQQQAGQVASNGVQSAQLQ